MKDIRLFETQEEKIKIVGVLIDALIKGDNIEAYFINTAFESKPLSISAMTMADIVSFIKNPNYDILCDYDLTEDGHFTLSQLLHLI